MKTWLKTLIGIFITLFVLVIFILLGSYFYLRKSLPEYEGVDKVKGINNEISIYRDQYAIPTIYAENDDDVYFALGYVHAQERLFQMDLTRRAGEGRLSEILGSKTIAFDKMFKTIGLMKVSEEAFKRYNPEVKNSLIAYANGVNEFIKNNPDKFTVEFSVLGYKPELWKPEHSILIAKLMAWELNISWWSDIAFTHLIQKLGLEKVKEIMPDYKENAPTIIPKKLEKMASVPLDFIKVDRDFRKFTGFVGTHIGSNNWVVNGKHSNSGKPIIANDPHLSFSVPGKWYIANLHSPNLNAEGVTLPGVPGIVIGKNKNISWVVTNVMADDSDFYIEKLDSTKTKYFFNNQWHQLEVYEDTIKVKDTLDVIFTIRKNHRGPIISDIHPYKKQFPNKEQNKAVISMRWTALEPTTDITAFYKINRAKNWKEFNEAVEYFTGPGQNFVYGDIEGNIGYVAGVRLPKRKNNSVSFVYDGTSDKNDWEGYVPFKENPRVYNPAQGFLASANNKTIEDYPYHISNVWEPASRIERITELLTKKEIHSKEDFQKYQMDFYSHYAEGIVPFIINAFKSYKTENKNLKTALKILKNWDYVLLPESQVPTVYAVFYQFLLKNIFEDEMGENLLNEYIFLANVPYRTVPVLLKENKSGWFDNVNTKAIETRDDIIRKSLVDAVDYLENNMNRDITYWQWGKLHKLTFKHFFHGISGILDKLFDVGPFEIGGDGTTVFNTEYSLTKPYDNKLGPSMRYIYDFAQPDKYRIVLPTGQSGDFISKHYHDMTTKWLEGKIIEINTNEDFIKNSDYDLLKLIPQR